MFVFRSRNFEFEFERIKGLSNFPHVTVPDLLLHVLQLLLSLQRTRLRVSRAAAELLVAINRIVSWL